MRLAIMQPYFFPYIGYFQLINSVDILVVYDNIKYTKKGWINRNRMLLNGTDVLFSIPLKSDSDSLNVDQRFIAESFSREKLLSQLRAAYEKAPNFRDGWTVIESAVNHPDRNLFGFIRHSIDLVCQFLDIRTPIVHSSGIEIDHSLQGQDKVLAMCRKLSATTYINAIGGQSLYSADSFRESGIDLKFIQSKPFEYPQFTEPFVPWLSILDVIMFNRLTQISAYLSSGYSLV